REYDRGARLPVVRERSGSRCCISGTWEVPSPLLPPRRSRPGRLGSSLSNLDKQCWLSKHLRALERRTARERPRVPPRGIEPLPQAPEACVISISPRGRGAVGYHKRPHPVHRSVRPLREVEASVARGTAGPPPACRG